MSLERIEITPFAVIVGEILQERRTGNLTVIRPPLRKILYWSQGELVLITSSAPEDSLTDFLVRRGIVAADPRVLPEGTVLKVVEPASLRGVYTVGDRGRAVKGREIDIFMPSCREATRFGRRQVQIRIQSAPPA